MMKIVATIVCFVCLCGCALTSIETPIGKYWSTRDSTLDSMEIQIVEAPDGTKTTTVKIGGASGQASAVIAAQAELLRVGISAAFEAAAKAGP